MNIMRQYAYMVLKPITAYSYDSLFTCMAVGETP